MGTELADVKYFPGVLNVFTTDGTAYIMQADSCGNFQKSIEMPVFRLEKLISRLQQCLLEAQSDGWVNQ